MGMKFGSSFERKLNKEIRKKRKFLLLYCSPFIGFASRKTIELSRAEESWKRGALRFTKPLSHPVSVGKDHMFCMLCSKAILLSSNSKHVTTTVYG